MFRETDALLLILTIAISFCFGSCQTDPIRSPVQKNGKLYGVTQGAFRHRWWNFYERGLSYSDGQFWKESEADFREALKQRNADQIRARTYGMHFVDYFPHRELGISLFYQKRYPEAIQELETSLSTETSAKAQFYLDKARTSLIRSLNSDSRPPRIALTAPSAHDLTNQFHIIVSGTVTDDTFAREIFVNRRPVRVDVSARSIGFEQEVPLRLGDNTITIEARDLIGRTSRITRKVVCDRTGPVLNVDEIKPSASGISHYRFRGYVYDDSGIRTLRINGHELLRSPVSEMELNRMVSVSSSQQALIVIAEDLAGNRTRADIPLPNRPRTKRSEASPLLLPFLEQLASGFLTGPAGNQIAAFGGAVGNFLTSDSPAAFSMLTSVLESGSKPEPVSGYEEGQRYSAARGGAVKTDFGEYSPGKNYALIVGINAYKEWEHLKTAVNDAKALKEVLTERYGFWEGNVVLLTDQGATEERILSTMMLMAHDLGESDNLLIYFAGHGQLNEQANDGYWIPVEGKRNQEFWTWIAHSAVKNIISSEELRAKNVIVIADSCYAGKLTRGGASDITPHKTRLIELASRKSRQMITSGSLEPVADWGRDNHSLFAYHLLKALRENQEPLIAVKSLINTHVWEPVFKISKQRPVISRFRTPMDEDGEFVLALQSKSHSSTAHLPSVFPAMPQFPAFDKRGVDNTPPVIALTGWDTHQTVFLNRAYIEGRIHDDTEVLDVVINGKSVLRRPSKNIYFHYLTELKEGDNPIILQATDHSGNSVRKIFHIRRKLQKVYEDASRMSAVLCPLEITGQYERDLDGMLLQHLEDSERFDMKSGKLRGSGNSSADNDEIARLAREVGAEFVFIGKGVFKAEKRGLEIRVRVVETETAEVVAVRDVYGEEVDPEFAHRMCEGLVVRLRDALPLVTGKVVKVKGKKVVVNLGKVHKVKKGMHVIFFEEGEEIIDQDTGKSLGADTEELGSARIRKVRKNMSHADILTLEGTDGPEVGQEVVMK